MIARATQGGVTVTGRLITQEIGRALLVSCGNGSDLMGELRIDPSVN